MANGRPRIVETPEEFEALAEEYYALKKADGHPLTVAGLAYHMGFESRQSFYDYGKRDGFSYVIKKARLLIEEQHEAAMMGGQVAGSIFWLKNHGWSDKQELEHSGGGTLEVNVTRRVIDAVG